MSQILYASVIESLLFTVVRARSDIVEAIRVISWYMITLVWKIGIL